MSIETFQLQSPSGKIYTAHRATSRIRVSNLSAISGHAYEEGLATVRLSDGRNLNSLPDGTYQIVNTGEILTRI